MPDFVWCNGQYLPRNEVKVNPFETGFLYGYGVFETLLVFNQKPFLLEDHFNRMKTSAKHIKLQIHMNLKTLEDVINRLIKLNSIHHGFIRLVASSAEEPMKSMKFSSSDATSLTGSASSVKKAAVYPSIFIVESGPVSPEYEKFREKGGAIILYPCRRSADTPYYKHKTLAYMENLLARRWAFGHKALEAIFTNSNNYIMEGTRSTLFIVKDRKVLTPSIESNILSGITRKVVIGLCTKHAFKIREQLLKHDDIFSANESFLTSSLMEVMPITACKYKSDESIKTKLIGNGEVGPMTKQLIASYRNLIETR